MCREYCWLCGSCLFHMHKVLACYLLCPNDHGYLQIKRKTVIIEDCWVKLSHDY